MRNTFDEAIGTSPASTIDVDTVVTRGRRRVSRRRFAVGGAGSGVVVVTSVVAALALGAFGPSAPARPDQGAGPASGGPPPAPDGSAPVRADETPDQIKQRLAATLVDGLSAALPGVQISDGPTGEPGVAIYHDPSGNLARYDSDTVITTETGEGEVFFESWPGGTVPGDGRPATGRGSTFANGGTDPALPVAVTWFESCADVPASYENCEATTGPDGQTIVVLSTLHREGAQGDTTAGGPAAEGAGAPIAFHEVYVTWTNAKVHLALASDTKRGEPDTVTAPLLLTPQQLATVAAHPDLTVTR